MNYCSSIYSSICIEIDGNDVLYENSPENGLKKTDCVYNDTKATRQAGKNRRILYFVFFLDKRRGDIYANKRRALLVS